MSPHSLLVAALAAVCSFAPAPRAQQPAAANAAPVAKTPALTAADVAAKVDALVQKELAKPTAVGLSIGIAQRGQVLLQQGYGRADAEFDIKADAATMFRIGSITKQFTSAIVMRWIEQGKLQLEDDITKYLPNAPVHGKKITIHHLLDHTSGIPSYTDIGAAWEAKQPLELKDEELLALVQDLPLDFEPGQGWHYNNTGYYLLGMLIAKVADKPYAQAVLDELCTPLHLERTRYDNSLELIANRAQGYQTIDGKLANDSPLGMSQPGAAGGILSTGGDLVRWSMALSSGKIVSAASFARMTTATVLPNGRNTHYGFGLMPGDLEGRPIVRHGGGINGFNSMLQWLPDADLHVAVISNSERLNATRLADAITCALLDIVPTKAKNEPTTQELRAKLAGTYKIADLGMDLKVFEQGDKLMVQATGQGAFAAQWQGGLEFRAAFDNAVKLLFAADAQSFELHQGGGVFFAQRGK